MKFNEETRRQCTEDLCKNPFWRGVYEGAPSHARIRLEVAFWGTKALNEHEDIDAYREYREQVEKDMSYEDAAYLAKNFPEGAGKKHYEELAHRKQFAALKTPEKLDEAMDAMMTYATPEEREFIEITRRLLDVKNNPYVSEDLIWRAVGGDGDQCHLVGDIFDHGHDVARNERLAFFWFRRGALCGDGDCCCRLADIYEDEDSPYFDFALANFWYREALRRGNALVRWVLGYRLAFGRGAWEKNRNPKLGAELLRLGLENDPGGDAHLYLGRCFEEGAGVEKDYQEAMRLYKVARRRGHSAAPEAIENLKKTMGER